MKSNQFTHVPVSAIPTNNFDLSHDVKLTCDAGYIIPVSCVEAIPGDRFSYGNTTFVRLAPMLSPVMHKMDVTTVTAFVPMRLIWENSAKFFADPVPDGTSPVPPYFANELIEVGSLGDYLGLPTQKIYDEATGGIINQYGAFPQFSALPFAAYQRFFNDWFRDENLYNGGQEIPNVLTDGLNNFDDFNVLRKRAWRHDYFTSCLPFAQKGDAVEIPIGTFAPIVLDSTSNASPLIRNTDGSFQSAGSQTLWSSTLGGSPYGTLNKGASTGTTPSQIDPNGTLLADLNSATAVTINTLRWAEKLQVFLEKNARGGTRYTELVRQHFGVKSSDARLQRAEFLGFSVQPITISEVLQTSPTTADNTPLAEMAGHGISYGNSKSVNYFAEEHGFFITMLNIRPRTAYMQGLSRMWTRKTPLDYPWPTFAQLGEQEIKNREIFLSGNPAYDDAAFGYLPRYAEFRYESDRVAGEMRTGYAYWHMARIFNETPYLNEDFISCTPTKRIFAVNAADSHPYIISINNRLNVRRCLPKYGIPAL